MIDAFGTVYVPEYPGIFFYIAVAGILMYRPQGLLSGIR
jgi:branched-chain amino acid transport system permease protein